MVSCKSRFRLQLLHRSDLVDGSFPRGGRDRTSVVIPNAATVLDRRQKFQRGQSPIRSHRVLRHPSTLAEGMVQAKGKSKWDSHQFGHFEAFAILPRLRKVRSSPRATAVLACHGAEPNGRPRCTLQAPITHASPAAGRGEAIAGLGLVAAFGGGRSVGRVV